MASSVHSIRFPNESAEYRAAREELLHAEMELRRKLEEVAALRRQLPLGGPVKEDYVFAEGGADLDDLDSERQVRLSELFREGKDTLLLYSYMFGPAMKSPCSSCTSILDGLNGSMPHVRQRGWRNLRLLSSAHNSYNADYHGETPEGDQIPTLNTFVRRDGRIYHFTSSELLFAPNEPGQDGRHVDLIWPLWNLFDLTPEGRGADWHPRLAYPPA